MNKRFRKIKVGEFISRQAGDQILDKGNGYWILSKCPEKTERVHSSVPCRRPIRLRPADLDEKTCAR